MSDKCYCERPVPAGHTASCQMIVKLESERDSLREQNEILKIECNRFEGECLEALKELSRMTIERDRYKKALKPFANLDIEDLKSRKGSQPVFARNDTALKIIDFLKAQSALRPEEKK